jgi:hypothetical protein
MLTDMQIERWRQLWQEANADSAWVAHNKELDGKRTKIRGEVADLLGRYLSGQVGTEELRATFDRRTRTDWEGFGFKGMSGAMFLNKLVKYLGDGPNLAGALRSVLRLPKDEGEGRTQMRSFLDFLDGEIKAGHVEKGQVQPARAPFFISCWWHIQDTEHWPIFYLSDRKVLELEGLFAPTQDPVHDYFAFRRCYLALSSALSIKSWDLEHLCYWQDARNTKDSTSETATSKGTTEAATEEPDDEEPEESQEGGITHAQVQWLLAKIGQRLGCKIWIAANDQNEEWKGERIGDLSIKNLPSLGLDAISQAIIRLIDVLWLKGANQVAAAFEIEHTTSIYSGLLRMSDLTASSPNLNFPLYIVAPEARLPKVQKELSRPTFQALELHRRCGFFSDEKLVKEADAIMRWANDPAVMEKLASKVPDMNSEG